jgi:prohibitin 2
MVEISAIIGIAFTIIIIGIIAYQIYKRRYGVGQKGQFSGFGKQYPRGGVTPEGEPLESYPNSGYNKSLFRVIIPAVIGLIIVIVLVTASVKTVDAGHRGVLLQFGAVEPTVSLEEGLHFVVPFRDQVLPIEVRTQKVVVSSTSASKDLQEVSTEVALNYHISPESAQLLYQQLGYDYSNRVILPAIQESVKQVTARFNAEELITNRETVKNQIEQQIQARLANYNIVLETLSITEFQFSEQFTRAIEAKVEAQQRALQAQNELRRIQIEANQTEARAIGEQRAAIAQATGIKQANVLRAEGESEAINIIDQQLRESPTYLEWLKAQRWNGELPLVLGGAGQGATPFIEIPTSRNEPGQNTARAEQNAGQNSTGQTLPGQTLPGQIPTGG